LLKLEATEHVVLLTMHHIISDGWSMGVLVDEVATLYASYKSGAVSVELSELPVQYADYAAWQRDWLQGEVLEGQLNYWREQLAELPPLLELPTDYARPLVQSFRGAELQFQLGGEVVEGLRRLCREQQVTLFMALLAPFQALLWRYTRERRVVVGTPIAGRTRAETEKLIGFFVNTLALTATVNGEMSWRELLQQVREVSLGAHAHQDVPFERLVEELRPERSLSQQPLVQVMFALQNASGSAVCAAGRGRGPGAVVERGRA
jgi:non-ribosomal peptide synthetase component F